MSDNDEACPTCQVAVLGGTILDICRNETKGLDCKQLKEDFVAWRLSAKELIDKVRGSCTDDIKEQIDNIEEWAKSEGVDLSVRAPPE